MWLLGVNGQDNSFTLVNNLPGNGVWAPASVCVQATGPHSSIRIEFYPTPGGPTVGLDVVSVL